MNEDLNTRILQNMMLEVQDSVTDGMSDSRIQRNLAGMVMDIKGITADYNETKGRK